MARTADIFTFDPYSTEDDPSIFTELQIYDRLVRLSSNGKSVDPELATSWKISPDGLTATFSIRKGVKFSDGSPLTVDDVVFSLSRATDQKGAWGFLFSPVKSVNKVDDSTVAIQMSEPFAPLLPALSTFAASIYSKANFEKWGKDAGTHPVGTGAFPLETWRKGSEVVLDRNPNYWQAGKPHIDRLIFRVIGDDNTRVLQLLAGQVDVIDFVPPNQVQQIQSGNGKVYRVDGTSVARFVFNNRMKPLDEANVRCAMAYAVDREAVARNIYFGYARPALSILPSTTFYYDPKTDPIGYDVQKAKALLAQSSVPNGFETMAVVPTGNSTWLGEAEIWANGLKQIGVNLKIQQVEATTAQELYNTERYTIRVGAWTNDTPDPDEYLGVQLDYTVQNALHTGYHSDPARQLVLSARKEMNPQKRQQMYSELQRVVNRDCPIAYIVEVPRLYASTSAVKGFAPNSQGKYGFENVSK